MATITIHGAVSLALAVSRSSYFAPLTAAAMTASRKGAFKGKGQRKANKANRWR